MAAPSLLKLGLPAVPDTGLFFSGDIANLLKGGHDDVVRVIQKVLEKTLVHLSDAAAPKDGAPLSRKQVADRTSLRYDATGQHIGKSDYEL